MENQKNTVSPLAMSYGLYMGLALILSAVIFYVMGNPLFTCKHLSLLCHRHRRYNTGHAHLSGQSY